MLAESLFRPSRSYPPLSRALRQASAALARPALRRNYIFVFALTLLFLSLDQKPTEPPRPIPFSYPSRVGGLRYSVASLYGGLAQESNSPGYRKPAPRWVASLRR